MIIIATSLRQVIIDNPIARVRVCAAQPSSAQIFIDYDRIGRRQQARLQLERTKISVACVPRARRERQDEE